MTSTHETEHRIVTLDLIRKRSEHNDGLVSNLEEIALHQEELQAIGPILARTCGRTLKILLLQNNVISRMDPYDFRPMKSLEYLNLALNNIKKVEGISHCEFLYKIDLTLNFIDVDTFQESLEHMKDLRSLKELYMIGNPCICEEPSTTVSKVNSKSNGWKGARMYIIAMLPQLQILDGKEISKSIRIQCMQRLPELQKELYHLVKIKSRKEPNRNDTKSNSSTDDLTEHTPEERLKISNDMSKIKKEKEQKSNQPNIKSEKEQNLDQIKKVTETRQTEEGRIKQCNEGKWNFTFDEETKPGFLLLDVNIQKYLSSSLIDVDIHPTYVSIVIKSKVLRLILPVEVKVGESVAQRSTTTGSLLLIMPKVDAKGLNFISTTKKKSTNKGNNYENNKSKKSGKSLTFDMIRYADICLNTESLSQCQGLSEMKEICTRRTDEIECDLLDEPPPLQ